MVVKVAVIGAGVMGGFHCALFRGGIAGAELVAVSDPDADRAALAAGGARIEPDAFALLAAPDVDAVLVAAPDAAHHALVMAAIAAGKPVLCEKPLAATVVECHAIIAAEQRAARPLVTVGFMRRFDPTYRELKAGMESEDLGAPRVLHCRHRNAAAPAWFTPEMAITNALVHEIDVCRWLLGAEYCTATVVPIGGGGDPLMVLLETNTGAIVSVEVFMNAGYGYHVHVEAVCEHGVVAMASPSSTRVCRSGVEQAKFSDNWLPRFGDAYRIQNQAWINAILAGGAVPEGAQAWDGLVATAIADQIRSVAHGGRIELSLPPRSD